MPISSYIDNHFDSEQFRVVWIQFKNESDKWVRVESAKLLRLNDHAVTAIPLGTDLKAWRESFIKNEAVQTYHEDLAFFAALSVGILGIVSADRAVVGVSDGILASAGVSTAAWKIETEKNLALGGKLKIEKHLYKSFSIPPGMLVRRWMLVQVPKEVKLHDMAFTMNYENFGIVKYEAVLNE